VPTGIIAYRDPGTKCSAIPSGQFLSSRSLVLAAPSWRSECSASDYRARFSRELIFAGLSRCADRPSEEGTKISGPHSTTWALPEG